jgi:hypothetical protein
MYEYGILKPVKVILRRGVGKRENDGEMNQSRIQYMYIWNCHNETPCITKILIKTFFKKIQKQRTGNYCYSTLNIIHSKIISTRNIRM